MRPSVKLPASVLLILAILVCLYPLAPALAQSGIEISDASVTYTFGNQIQFTAQVRAAVPLSEILISFRSNGNPETIVGTMSMAEDGMAQYTYDLSQRPLRAFSTVEYWFTVKVGEDQAQNSPTYSFFYLDNRFDWQTLEAEAFQVHWYEGDLAFAQTVSDVAQEGLQRTQELLPLRVSDQIHIFVYASPAELQQTLLLSGYEWVAGHADPDLHSMQVSLPPGIEQRLEAERQIPHELMHILLYQTYGRGYSSQPAWLDEGLASLAELYPTSEYETYLKKSAESNTLIPLSTICQNIPVDASSYYLAYAESYYFVKYLYDQFGSSGLQSLLQVYADGVGCERGTEIAFGSALPKLENQWLQDTFGVRVVRASMVELLPWFALLLVILAVPFFLAAFALFPKKESSISRQASPTAWIDGKGG